MKNLMILLICAMFLNACKKVEETKYEVRKPEPPIFKDVELEKWRENLKKESFTFDISQTPNPFIGPNTQKILTQKEEAIPLELVGIIDKNGQKLALLQDPTKRGYILKKGDKIGSTYIKEIGDDYLVIEEMVVNLFGTKSKRLRKLSLKKGESTNE